MTREAGPPAGRLTWMRPRTGRGLLFRKFRPKCVRLRMEAEKKPEMVSVERLLKSDQPVRQCRPCPVR